MAGKSLPVQKEARKGKEIVTEKAVEVVTEKGSEKNGIGKEPQVRNSKFLVVLLRNLNINVRISILFSQLQ